MDDVLYEKKDHIATITLNRPQALNALAPATMEELSKCWLDARDDRNVWVIVITGAGADLKELIPYITAGNTVKGDGFLRNTPIWKPILAAINGHALAGGCELVLATDIRVAVPNALFGLAEARWGLLPAGGGTQRLPRQVSYCNAMEILLMARPIQAEDAYRIGLVNRVVPPEELMPTVTKMAETICENGPLAVRSIKESALRGLSLPLEQGLVIEDFLGAKVFASEDAKEGPRAFAEKRKPNFQGR